MVLCNSIVLHDTTCRGGTNRTDISIKHLIQKIFIIGYFFPLTYPSKDLIEFTNIQNSLDL